MKTKNVFFLGMASLLLMGSIASCEKTAVAETETLYEVQGVDKRNIERPGNQGGN